MIFLNKQNSYRNERHSKGCLFIRQQNISERNYKQWIRHCKYVYRKNSKNWDALDYYRDCPTNGIVGFYSAILRSKDADRITNRVDTDQTEEQSGLGLHCFLRPICPNILNYYGTVA